MGHIKDITNQGKIQTFPSSTFEIAGEVPAAQCSEAKIEGDDAWTENAPNQLNHFLKFVGWNLAGKICHITYSNGGLTGNFFILSNSDFALTLLEAPGFGNPVTYFVTDGGALILTRNVQSFAQYIHAAGYAYTIKGGMLYTNMPSAQLQNACTILFDPLT